MKNLKKKGRAFRNIGKVYFSDREISLVFFFALFLLKNVLENPDLQVTGGGWWGGKGEGRGRWGRALEILRLLGRTGLGFALRSRG